MPYRFVYLSVDSLSTAATVFTVKTVMKVWQFYGTAKFREHVVGSITKDERYKVVDVT
jgi:hypothetical protein